MLVIAYNLAVGMPFDDTTPKPYFYLLSILPTLLYSVYVYGFAALSRKHSVRRLAYAAYAWIGIALLSSFGFLLPFDADPTLTLSVGTALGLALTVAMLLVGWSVLQLKAHYGPYAVGYGLSVMFIATGLPYMIGGIDGSSLMDLVAYALAVLIFFKAAKQ